MSRGYRQAYVPRGSVGEHRLVAEAVIGRRLLRYEVVHHIDGDPGNNDPENLLVLERRLHKQLHAAQRARIAHAIRPEGTQPHLEVAARAPGSGRPAGGGRTRPHD